MGGLFFLVIIVMQIKPLDMLRLFYRSWLYLPLLRQLQKADEDNVQRRVRQS